jgi:uncharacterized membrane protein
MRERGLRLASAALAAVGVLLSGYLLVVRETGGTLVCATGGCETVQSSRYAEVLGLPVAAIGLIGFIGLLGTALARGEWARLAQATLALSAFAFGAYLLVIQLAVIGAVCQWCIATDLVTTALATVALLRLIAPAPAAATPAPRPIPYPKPQPNRSRKRTPPTKPLRRPR